MVMIELAALDIAGTTIDDRHLVYAALRDCLTTDGVEVSNASLSAAMGTRKDHAIGMLLAADDKPHDAETVTRYYTRFTELLTQYYTTTPPAALPDVESAIAKMKSWGIKVALTTGFSREIAGMVLEHAGWSVGPNGTVDTLVCSDEVAAGRPAPHLIHRAMERTGVHDVNTVITAGDTVADLLAGTNSGARLVVGVLTGPTSEAVLLEHPHTHITASAADLPGIIINN